MVSLCLTLPARRSLLRCESVSSIYILLEASSVRELENTAAAKSRQSCPTLCDPLDGSPTPWDSPGKNTGAGCHFLLQCMKVKSESEATQSCLTLSDPMVCSLPGSSIRGILQARVLEWVAIAYSDKSPTQTLLLTISLLNLVIRL